MGSTNSFNLLSTHNNRMMLRTLFILSMSVLQASHCSPTREEQSGNETTARLDFSRNGFSCETNDWDKPQWCLCQKGERVSKIYSVHDNKKEDRKWTLTCGSITPEFIVPNKNDWYEKSEENNWDGQIYWKGAANANHGFLVGMSSYHSNSKEDRKYTFFSVRSDNWYTTDCKWRNNVNDWDGKLSWTLGDDEVIGGLYSVHSNKKEDRQWSIQVCKLRKKCTEISKIEYNTVVSDVTEEEVSAGKQVFDNRNGQLDNSYTAEISQTSLSSLTESYEFSQTSGWENEVSMSVTAGVTLGVPAINEYSLEVTVGASSSWSFEQGWTRGNSKEYSEENGRRMSFTANCKAGCKCTLDVVVKTAKGVIPYTMWSQSVDKKHQCIEQGDLTVDYSFDGHATVNDEC